MKNSILAEFDKAMNERPGLSQALGLYKEILKVQLETTAKQPVPAIPSAKQLEEAISQGKPLVTFVPVEVDFSEFIRTFHRISNLLAKHKPDQSREFKKISGMDWRFPELVRMFWNNNSEGIIERAKQAKVKESAFSMLFTSTLKPFYMGYARHLHDLVPEDQWLWPYCPICGQKPVMSKRTENHSLQLYCSFCSTLWSYPSWQCPFCSSGLLEHLELEEEENSLYVCRHCKSYLKSTPPTCRRDLFLMDIITIHLDFLAESQGYSRP